eukprot:9503734-Pyramimonas_sp.AAC.2
MGRGPADDWALRWGRRLPDWGRSLLSIGRCVGDEGRGVPGCSVGDGGCLVERYFWFRLGKEPVEYWALCW